MESKTQTRQLLWMVVLGYMVCSVDAALKTTFIEDLCYHVESSIIDLRYQNSGILLSAPRLSPNFNCHLTLLPPRDNSVVLSVFRYDIGPDDFLTIEDSDLHKISLLGHGIFKDEKKSFISDGKMVIHYRRNYTSDLYPRVGFQFTFTKVKASPCFDNEFKCNNGKCVLKEYVCDGHNHCGDGSDQKKCGLIEPSIATKREVSSAGGTEPGHAIFILTTIISILVVLTVIIVPIVVLVRRSKLKKAAAQNPSNPTNAGGNIPLSTVSAEVPTVHQLPQPATSPEAAPGSSLWDRVRRSLRRSKNPETEEVPKEQSSAETYQVPSMYPSLEANVRSQAMYPNLAHVPSAPEMSGIVNPDFKIEE